MTRTTRQRRRSRSRRTPQCLSPVQHRINCPCMHACASQGHAAAPKHADAVTWQVRMRARSLKRHADADLAAFPALSKQEGVEARRARVQAYHDITAALREKHKVAHGPLCTLALHAGHLQACSWKQLKAAACATDGRCSPLKRVAELRAWGFSHLFPSHALCAALLTGVLRVL